MPDGIFTRMFGGGEEARAFNTDDTLPQGMTKPMADAVMGLLRFYDKQCEKTHRIALRAREQAREFFKGNQRFSWSQREARWVPYSASGGVRGGYLTDTPSPFYVINIYQAFQLSMQQIVCAGRWTRKFWPKSPASPMDVKAATAADGFMRYHEMNTDLSEELRRKFFYLWVDGTFGTHTAFVRDKQRFGSTQILDPMTGQPTEQANGKAQTTVYGGTSLRVPSWCDDFSGFPFLRVNGEVDRSLLKAMYPKVSRLIDGHVGQPESTLSDLERRVRLQTRGIVSGGYGSTSQNDESLVTFSRTWLRPWAFNGVEDADVRMALTKAYPDGLHIAHVGDLVCDAYGDVMDERWSPLCHALPGEGQIREPIGGSIVGIQQLLNDLVNLMRDNIEFQMPIGFYDKSRISSNLFNTRVRGGAFYPMASRPGQSMADAITTTRAGDLPQGISQVIENVSDKYPRQLIGAYEAAFGAPSPGNETFGGMQLERDQAMARMGMYTGLLRRHDTAGHNCQMMLELRAYRDNWKGPLAYADNGDDGSPVDVTVDPTALIKGNFTARPEVDEDYPVTFPQKRALAFELMKSYPDLMMDPANSEAFKRLSGATDFTFPGADAWKKQMSEIQDMLTAPPPQQIPGMPMQPPYVSPVSPLENHQFEMKAIQDWWNSPAARKAQKLQPMQVQAIQQHYMMHEQQAAMQAMQQMGPGGPGGPPPSQPGPGPGSPPSAPPEGPPPGPG